VRIQQVTDDIAESSTSQPTRGALVAGIDDKGPAKPAGIEPGDVIVRFDGKDIKEMRDLPARRRRHSGRQDVEVIVVRKGKEEKKTVRLGRLEDGEKQAAAGAKKDAEPQEKSVVQKTLGLNLANITTTCVNATRSRIRSRAWSSPRRFQHAGGRETPQCPATSSSRSRRRRSTARDCRSGRSAQEGRRQVGSAACLQCEANCASSL